jgi:hypothetical protein
MQLVYLDQNAASNLARAEGEWQNIRALLSEGFQRQQISCPMPMETLLESAACDRALRVAIEEFFESVSGGTRFNSYTDILINETLALVREAHQVVLFGLIRHGWGEREEAAQAIRESWDQDRDEMTTRVRGYTFPEGAENMTVEEIFRGSSLERCARLWRDLHKFLSEPRTLTSEYESSWLMRGLISLNLSPDEAMNLCRAIQEHKWDAIPVNCYDLLLGSRWDHDAIHGQRPNYYPNDEIDRWRAAVALSYTDVFITDGYVADLCRRAIAARYTHTAIFSVGRPSSILEYLTGCIGGR